MSTIQNNQTVGHVNGCCKITFVGYNTTTTEYGIYGITIGIPQEGISYDDENILGRAVETENVFNCRGNLATKQKGNQTINEKTFDIATNDDFNYVVNNIAPEINRDTFRAILKGTKIKNSAGATNTNIVLIPSITADQEIVVLGTQGQSWIGGTEFTTIDTFYWFENDGQLIKPDQLDSSGDPVLTGNTIKAPYEKSALFMVEFLYAFNDTKKNGDRFAYVMSTGSTMSEGSGTSPNSHSFSMERFSDVRSIKEYYLQGGNMEGTFPITGEAQKSLTCDYLSTTTAPTTGGTDGETACEVDDTTGVITVYLNTAGTWASVGTTTFTKGTNIHTNSTSASADLSDADGTRAVVVVDTAGANAVAIAYDNKFNGVGGTPGDFFVKKYDWDYGLSTPIFNYYIGTED